MSAFQKPVVLFLEANAARPFFWLLQDRTAHSAGIVLDMVFQRALWAGTDHNFILCYHELFAAHEAHEGVRTILEGTRRAFAPRHNLFLVRNLSLV